MFNFNYTFCKFLLKHIILRISEEYQCFITNITFVVLSSRTIIIPTTVVLLSIILTYQLLQNLTTLNDTKEKLYIYTYTYCYFIRRLYRTLNDNDVMSFFFFPY